MGVKFSDVEGHLLKVSLSWLHSFTVVAQYFWNPYLCSKEHPLPCRVLQPQLLLISG